MAPTSSVADSLAIPSATRARIRKRLLHWYDQHKRDLPWRRRFDDPYAQWVAEIMLQQTRVDTVEAYYERFLGRFPDIHALAVADHEDVLKHWEGLGYYRRALHLHRAARIIHEQNRDIPSTVEELRQLPGVGQYTAAAIASIAFGRCAAAVDGNIARVLARLFGNEQDVLSTPGKRALYELATQLISPRRPGDFNQAWMDLGSAICTPRSPSCDACPLVSLCVAARTGQADALPRRGSDAPRKPLDVTLVVGLLLCEGKMLVRRRPPGGLWSGLWEFPTAELAQRSQLSPRLRTLITDEQLVATGRARNVGTVQHKLTHRTMLFHICVVRVERCDSASSSDRGRRWVSVRGFERLALPTAYRRVLETVRNRLTGPFQVRS